MSVRIHFINRIDMQNAGDRSCCPLYYYYDFFRQYNIVRHDIDFIDWSIISPEDVVIIGGSGMLNVTESFNIQINNLLDRCNTVIAWAVGYNTHDQQWFQGEKFGEINIKKFSLVSIRDYMHPTGMEYVPCPSVHFFANYYLPNEVGIKRKYGVIQHKDLPIPDNVPGDRISNREELSVIRDFILSSEVILTNSYHCAYWSILLSKKVIVINSFSTKFDYFKYKPEFIEIGVAETRESIQVKIDVAASRAQIYDKAMEDAIKRNDEFFHKVKEIIEKNIEPDINEYHKLYQLDYLKSWNIHDKLRQAETSFVRIQEIQESLNHIINDQNERHCEYYDKINSEHEEFHNRINKLHDELFGAINNLHDEFYQAMNGLHDEVYSAINEIRKVLDNKDS